MRSILTVTDRADNRLLVTREAVKAELGIAEDDDTQNDAIDELRARASQAIVGYCHREFAKDVVSELFRPDRRIECLTLAGFPDPARADAFCTITSVTEDDTVLVADTDFEVDPGAGLLYRLDGVRRRRWRAHKIVVVHNAGYVLPDDAEPTLPNDVQDAALRLIRDRWSARQRDSRLKTESIEGVGSQTFWVTGEETGNMTPDIQDLLAPFANLRV